MPLLRIVLLTSLISSCFGLWLPLAGKLSAQTGNTTQKAATSPAGSQAKAANSQNNTQANPQAKAATNPPANTPANKPANPPAGSTNSANPPAANPPAAEVPPPPDLSIPPGADKAKLNQILTTAKKFLPRDQAQYKLQQTAIRDVSQALIKAIEDKNDPVRMQAELDSLSSNAALMVNESEEAREKVLERIQTYLKGRKELTLADVQTGMIVAFHLELQPRKSPARDVYATLVELLEKDTREEMQALRINLQANVRRLEMLGNKFELGLSTIDGKQIKTEDYAGKFVIVDFFATWCGPCIAEVPRLKKFYDKHRDKGLEIIGISLDDDRAVLDKYLEGAKLPWPVIHDSATDLKDKLQIRYGISSLPTVLLLNKEGVVVSLEARGAELERLMDRIFEAPTPAAPEVK